MIAVIDYGVGNLYSLKSSLEYLNIESVVTKDSSQIAAADRIILPGVGAFRDAAAKLSDSGLKKVIVAEAGKGKPLLGICLGMQLLFEKSFEYGCHEGLGLIKGIVAPIEDDLTEKLKVPHIGWNALRLTKPSPLLKYVKDGDFVYYVHSYYAKECGSATVAVSEYGISITGAVESGNVFGTQFHPEKSGGVGLNILRAFNEV